MAARYWSTKPFRHWRSQAFAAGRLPGSAETRPPLDSRTNSARIRVPVAPATIFFSRTVPPLVNRSALDRWRSATIWATPPGAAIKPPLPLRLIGPGIFPAAPSRALAVGRLGQHGLDLVQLAASNLENLGDFPGERRRGSGGHGAAVGSLKVAGVSRRVVGKNGAEDHPPFLVDHEIAAIANPRNEVEQAGLKLVPTGPARGIRRRLHGRIVLC